MNGRLIVAVAAAALLVAPALALPADASHGSRLWSAAPPGPYGIVWPAAENFTASDGTHVSYAVYLPDVPAGTRVPAILTAGPYFALVESAVTAAGGERLLGFLVENFVPHGYAVVAASVRGTGWSGGCVELMSLREARDLDELVTFLATRAWSSGSFGVTGKSYDGGVAWMAAQFGNPAIDTIVPIAGVPDFGDLMIHRGTPEFRAPLMHAYVYYPFGFGETPEDPVTRTLFGDRHDYGHGRALEDRLGNANCPELARGAAAGAYSTATGDMHLAPVVRDYWAARDFVPDVVANYTGSVFIVHGLQDWNVKPRQAVPVFDEIPHEKKMWLGQWGHHYPDENVPGRRADFAATLLAWFDKHLKGLDVDTGPVVEVQEHRSLAWRSLPAWPAPTGSVTFALRSDGTLATSAGDSFRQPVVPPSTTSPCYVPPTSPNPVLNALYAQQRLSNAKFTTTSPSTFRLSGVGVVDVRLDPATSGSVVAVLCASGEIVAHGAANMLYRDGTNDLAPYVPGAPLDLRIELEAAEVVIEQGEPLVLSLRTQPYFGNLEDSYFPSAKDAGVVLAGGRVTLPTA